MSEFKVVLERDVPLTILEIDEILDEMGDPVSDFNKLLHAKLTDARSKMVEVKTVVEPLQDFVSKIARGEIEALSFNRENELVDGPSAGMFLNKVHSGYFTITIRAREVRRATP